MFGRKNFFLVCIALFTASSLLCGFAWNLQSLLVFRVIQGLAGGGMTPVAQSILAAAFPPAKRSQGYLPAHLKGRESRVTCPFLVIPTE
jgi:MFS transporter, DHA2 family, multidrug resistance protein